MNVNPFVSRANLFRCGWFLTTPYVQFWEKLFMGLGGHGLKEGAAAGLADEGERRQHRMTCLGERFTSGCVALVCDVGRCCDETRARRVIESVQGIQPTRHRRAYHALQMIDMLFNSINAWPICLSEQWRRA
jgi:hypothetical protein